MHVQMISILWVLCTCVLISQVHCVSRSHTYSSISTNTTCKCTLDFGTVTLHCHLVVSDEIRQCFERYKTASALVFKNSSLKTVPVEVGILQNLRDIDLSNNLIEAIDFSKIHHVCRRLERVVLNFNKIRILHRGSLDCFSNLEKLHIMNNTLLEIEDGTFNSNLTQLKYIYLHYNDLERFDTSLIGLPKFFNHESIHINASFNKVAIFSNSPHFTIDKVSETDAFYIDLIHNNFTSLDILHYLALLNFTDILQLINLRNCAIDMRFNPFTCDCNLYPLARIIKDFRYLDPNNPLFSIACDTPRSLNGMMLYSVPDNQFNCTVTEHCPHDCDCRKTVSLELMTVSCGDDYHVTVLPVTVPSATSIALRIHSANLEILQSRPYMDKVNTLDVSQSGVNTIDTSLLPLLDNVPNIYLHDNALTELPTEIQQLNFTKIKVLRLASNPYSCDCHSLWLKKWLILRKDYIPNQEKIICATGPGKGTPVIRVKDGEFICEGPLSTNEIIGIVCGVVLGIVVVILIVYQNKTSIQILMIAHFGVTCCRKKVKSTLKYDVFVSHSSKDDEFVWNVLRPMLENANPPFSLCLDERNFQPGKTIVLNIINAIETSLTTLIVVSNNFLRSDWCKMEFREAHMKLLRDRMNMVMIVLGDIDRTLLEDNDELKHYMNTNVYIKYRPRDKYFWPRILQTLPIRQAQDDDEMDGERDLLL